MTMLVSDPWSLWLNIVWQFLTENIKFLEFVSFYGTYSGRIIPEGNLIIQDCLTATLLSESVVLLVLKVYVKEL